MPPLFWLVRGKFLSWTDYEVISLSLSFCSRHLYSPRGKRGTQISPPQQSTVRSSHCFLTGNLSHSALDVILSILCSSKTLIKSMDFKYKNYSNFLFPLQNFTFKLVQELISHVILIPNCSLWFSNLLATASSKSYKNT